MIFENKSLVYIYIINYGYDRNFEVLNITLYSEETNQMLYLERIIDIKSITNDIEIIKDILSHNFLLNEFEDETCENKFTVDGKKVYSCKANDIILKEKFNDFCRSITDDTKKKIKFCVINPFDWVFLVNTLFDFDENHNILINENIDPNPCNIENITSMFYDIFDFDKDMEKINSSISGAVYVSKVFDTVFKLIETKIDSNDSK